MFKKIWYAEMIQNHILERQGKEPLNSYYYATTYPDVYAAAERTFGSWGEAIESCGIDYNTVRKYKTWTKQAVLDKIRELDKKGEPLYSQYAQNHYKSLYMAAIKRFKNWGHALRSAGIKYDDVRLRRSMTPEEIKKEILKLFRQKENLSYTNMRKNYQYLLAAGMKKLGDGSWARARRQCGILTNYRLNSVKKKNQADIAQTRAKATTKAKAKVATKAKAKVATKAKAKVATKAKAKVATKAKVKVKTKAKAKTKARVAK